MLEELKRAGIPVCVASSGTHAKIGRSLARTGLARANEMAMLGERISAQRALDWGLINRVVPDQKLTREADALLEQLATGPTASYAGWKRLVNRRVFTALAEQLDAEADAQGEQGRTEDFVEGVLAFLSERGYPDAKAVHSAEESLIFALPPELRRDMRAAQKA